MTDRVPRLIVPALAVALLCWASPDPLSAKPKSVKPAKENAMLRTKEFVAEKGLFRCAVPADWRQVPDDGQDARSHVAGVMLEGPASAEGGPPVLTAFYYGPGNTVAEDAEAFLGRQFRPGRIKLPGDEDSAVSDTVVAGRKARTFTRKSSRLYPPDSVDAKKVPMLRETVVIANKPGFFVLELTSPASSSGRWRPALKRMLESFKVP